MFDMLLKVILADVSKVHLMVRLRDLERVPLRERVCSRERERVFKSVRERESVFQRAKESVQECVRERVFHRESERVCSREREREKECVCVFQRERERERERECVCVPERKREREREGGWESFCYWNAIIPKCKNSDRPCPVGWGCRIHRLHLWRGDKTFPNECPGIWH